MDLKKLEDRIRLLPADGIGGKKDLLPLYADKEALGALVTYLAEPFRGKVDYSRSALSSAVCWQGSSAWD